MEKSNLLKKLSGLGFPLSELKKDDADFNEILADMVGSEDIRMPAIFPVLLAISAETGLFDYDEVKEHLVFSDEVFLSLLIALSFAVYEFFNLKFLWADKLYKSLPDDVKKEEGRFLQELKDDKDIGIAGRVLSVQRIKTAFDDYFLKSRKELHKLLVGSAILTTRKNEASLEYFLSQVFSPKQKELFFKKLRREKLSKTEKEYFSRVVKKKVKALANPELHQLAQRVME